MPVPTLEDVRQMYDSPKFNNRIRVINGDLDRYNLVKYQMRDLNTRQVLADIVNVTSNRPNTFGKKIINRLAVAEKQPVISFDKQNDDRANLIERFLIKYLNKIDLFLLKRNIYSLQSYVGRQLALQQGIAVRVWTKNEADAMPWEFRNTAYMMGKDGYEWASNRIRKHRDLIKAEHGITVNEEEVEVIDCWTKKENILWIDDRPRVIKHDLGYVPVVIVESPLGDSIYESVREIYEHENLISSVIATLTRRALTQGYQLKVADPYEHVIDQDQNPFQERIATPVERDGGYELIPQTDVNKASELLYNLVFNQDQQGTLPNVEFSQIPGVMSGEAISKLGGATKDMDQPLFYGMNIFYTLLSDMLIKQYPQSKVDLGIKKDELKGDYELFWKFFPVSPEDDQMNYTMAKLAKGFVSDQFIDENILNLQNPAGVRSQKDAEQAERIAPALFMYRRASALIKEGKPLEAKLVATSMKILLRQMAMAQQTPQEVTEPPISEPGAVTRNEVKPQ